MLVDPNTLNVAFLTVSCITADLAVIELKAPSFFGVVWIPVVEIAVDEDLAYSEAKIYWDFDIIDFPLWRCLYELTFSITLSQ